jgi:hypothetical protein
MVARDYFLDYVAGEGQNANLFVIYGSDKNNPIAQDISPNLAAGEFGLHLLRVSTQVKVEASDLQKEKNPAYVAAVERMVEHHNAHFISNSKKSLLTRILGF